MPQNMSVFPPSPFWGLVRFGALALSLCGVGLLCYFAFAYQGSSNTQAMMMGLTGAAAAYGAAVWFDRSPGVPVATAFSAPPLAQTLDDSPDAYVSTNSLGMVLAVNKAARALIQDMSAPRRAGPKSATEVFAFDSDAKRLCYAALKTAVSQGQAEALFRATDSRGLAATLTRVKDDFIWRLTPAEPIEEAPTASLATHLPHPAYIADQAGDILEINAALRALMGLKQAGAGAVQPKLENMFAEGAEHLTTDAVWSGRVMLKTPDGAQAVRVSQCSFEDADAQRRIGVVCTAEAASAIDQGAPTLDFLQGASIAMAIADGDGALIEANTRFKQLWSGAAAPGARLADLAAPTDRDEFRARLKTLARTGAVDNPTEITLSGEDDVVAQVYLHRADAEDSSRIVANVLDVSNQKKLEVQFAQIQKFQAVGQLAGGIAHDFNNMLTTIMGNCDFLLERHDQADPSFQEIWQIRSQANRAAVLVRKLLEFSRKQTLHPRIAQLSDEISELSAMLRSGLSEKITLKIDHGRNLWSVLIDVSEFERALTNIIFNARDAIQDAAGKGGSEHGRVTISTRNFSAEKAEELNSLLISARDYVLIEVRDTGAGIAPEAMGRIFEPFFSTKGHKGHGMGLSSVYGIVRQMGGHILPDNLPEGGAVFRIYLPRADGAPVAKPEVEATGPDVSGKGVILLVEDEDALRAMSSRALSSRGYEVIAVGSAEDALEEMVKPGVKIDLIVSDVVLPNMDGPTLLQKVEEMGLGAKVILISGYAEEAFRKNLKGHEKFIFLPKPFSLRELALKAKQALSAAD